MKKSNWFQKMIAATLAVALMVGIMPVMAAEDAEEAEETSYEWIAESISVDPMLGVQSGVRPAELKDAGRPRSREELLALDNVVLSEDGEPVAIRFSSENNISEEEMRILLGGSSAAPYSLKAKDSNQELREQFGLTDSQIEQGEYLHGNMLAFTNELSNLLTDQQYIALSDAQTADLIDLIASGYTYYQALCALVTKDIVGLSLEDLKAARVAEIETIRADEEDSSDSDIASESERFAEKLGLPSALGEQILASQTMSGSEIEAAMDRALDELYPSLNEDEDNVSPLAISSSSDPYSPEEVLGKPYAYDHQGNFDVNLNTGAYSYTETDLSIPGKNGLDLVLTRQYNSDQARAMSTYGWYAQEAVGRTSFLVSYRWYEVDTSGSHYTFTREITAYDRYTFSSSEGAQKSRWSFEYDLDNIAGAVAKKEAMRDLDVYFAKDTYGDWYSIALVPTIDVAGLTYRKYFNTRVEEDYYLVNEFGLGNGWMLGLSHFRWINADGDIDNNDYANGSRKQLTLSDGTRYYIRNNVGYSGNYIEDYDTDDLMFHRCYSSEHPGAAYGLYHKDGKVEYFDSNGRNIAIVDRFGNAITLAYTVEGRAVSKIQITDTMANTIIYEKIPVETPGRINRQDYDGHWRLTLNGETVRDYYTYTSSRTIDNTDVRTTQLRVVANEAEEFTNYYHYTKENKFNCILQPTQRNITSSSTVFPNDGTDIVVALNRIVYPNGGESAVSYTASNVEAYGDNGYRHVIQCTGLKNLNSADISWDNISYKIGDYDNLEGLKTICSNFYFTDEVYKQSIPVQGTDGNGSLSFRVYDMEYRFNQNGQLVNETKTSYSPAIGYHDSVPENYRSMYGSQSSWLAQKTTYTYRYPEDRRPETVHTVYHDADSGKEMVRDEEYTYDGYGNLLKYKKPNGQTETYTYDTAHYSLPLTSTVWQNGDTKITSTNTLTTNGKSIASTVVKSNSDIVEKTNYRYDSAGRLVAQDDYLSADEYDYVTTSYTYGSSALPIQVSVQGVENAFGGTATGTPGFSAGTVARKQTYNKWGWVTSETDANGNTTNYTYDKVGRPTKVTHPDGTSLSYEYNVAKRTVTYTDETGSSWLCTYGKSGKLLTVTDLTSNQVLQANTYDQYDRLVKQVIYGNTTPDQTTYYRYDTDGRVIEKACVGSKDSVLYQELYTYQDGIGKTTKTVVGDSTAPSVVTTTYQDNMGNVMKAGIFRNGKEELDSFAYDYLGNQTQSMSAYSATQNCKYTTASTYDHAGRLLSVTDDAGNTLSKTYDWLGNQLTQTAPKDQNTDPNQTKYPTVYIYDVLGRLVQVQTPLAAGFTGRTDYIYDANGNVTQERIMTGAKGKTLINRITTYTYDSRNRLTQAKGDGPRDSASGTTQDQYTKYTYDALGNIKSMSIGSGANWKTTQYTYDRYSRLLTQTDPLGQTQRYAYDLNGLLTSKTDRRGVTTTNTYDAMGRLIGSKAGTDSLAFTYTKSGLRKSATSNGQTTTYTYNSAGDLLKEITPVATKTMTYGVGGLRNSFTVTGNGKTYLSNQYNYNKLGYLTEVTSGNVNAHYSYDSNGNLVNVTNGNGTTAAYSYNKANMVTEIKNKRSSTWISNYKYTYGADGNQLTKTDVQRSITTNYTYDPLNRLTQETQTGTGAFTNTYTYDDYSNRSQATLDGVVTSYAYDANNCLLSTSGGDTATYTYDKQGNMTQAMLTVGGTTRTLNCTYNNFNQLTKVSDNGVETVYTYDTDGHRINKVDNGISEQYVWDGDQLVVAIAPTAEQLFSGTIPSSGPVDGPFGLVGGKQYFVEVNGKLYSAKAELDIEGVSLFGGPSMTGGETPEIPPVDPGPTDPPVHLGTFVRLVVGDVSIISADGGTTGTVEGPAGTTVSIYTSNPNKTTTAYVRGLSLIASKTDKGITYYHYNAHGDVVQLTDSTGNVIRDYTYDAFGVEQGADEADANPFRYSGEQFDAETGNYYLRARYYAPGTGRFTQEDPIMDGLNWYAYCAGNPVAFVDPSGQLPWSSVGEFMHDATHDTAGLTILAHWLYGGGKEMNLENNLVWSTYMTNNARLRSQVSNVIKEQYNTMAAGDVINLNLSMSMEIENGEQIIGYQYLHGTNADVGGFQIIGTLTKYSDNSALVECTYRWNDIIDPNFYYDTDSAKAQFAKSIPFADPTDYVIRISWYDSSVISPTGKFTSGWFAGKWQYNSKAIQSPDKGDTTKKQRGR